MAEPRTSLHMWGKGSIIILVVLLDISQRWCRISNNQSEHDYLRDTLVSVYKECVSCKIRTQFTCIKCGYCYSCHWKKEELEKEVEPESSTTTNIANEEEEKYPQHAIIVVEHSRAVESYLKGR